MQPRRLEVIGTQATASANIIEGTGEFPTTKDLVRDLQRFQERIIILEPRQNFPLNNVDVGSIVLNYKNSVPKDNSVSLNAAQRISTNKINPNNYRQNLDKV